MHLFSEGRSLHQASTCVPASGLAQKKTIAFGSTGMPEADTGEGAGTRQNRTQKPQASLCSAGPAPRKSWHSFLNRTGFFALADRCVADQFRCFARAPAKVAMHPTADIRLRRISAAMGHDRPKCVATIWWRWASFSRVCHVLTAVPATATWPIFDERFFYSMILSASCWNCCDTLRPSALAVVMLTMNSYLVGACTGRSVGFSPLRMRSAYDAASLNSSRISLP